MGRENVPHLRTAPGAADAESAEDTTSRTSDQQDMQQKGQRQWRTPLEPGVGQAAVNPVMSNSEAETSAHGRYVAHQTAWTKGMY